MPEEINPIRKREKDLHVKLYDFLETCNFPKDIKSLIYKIEEIDAWLRKMQYKRYKEDVSVAVVNLKNFIIELDELVSSKNDEDILKKYKEYKIKKTEIENLTNPGQPRIN